MNPKIEFWVLQSPSSTLVPVVHRRRGENGVYPGLPPKVYLHLPLRVAPSSPCCHVCASLFMRVVIHAL
jgi:hypothetical protein